MATYKTLHGIRVVEPHELDDLLFELEAGAKATGGIDACLSEPIALEALEYLRTLAAKEFAVQPTTSTGDKRPSGCAP